MPALLLKLFKRKSQIDGFLFDRDMRLADLHSVIGRHGIEGINQHSMLDARSYTVGEDLCASLRRVRLESFMTLQSVVNTEGHRSRHCLPSGSRDNAASAQRRMCH